MGLSSGRALPYAIGMANITRFGPHEVDEQKGTLRVHGEVVELQPLPWRMLMYLLEHPRELVGREELIEVLWPGQVAVTDASLGQVVHRLRRVLDGDLLKTVPRRGYRFDVDITKPDPPVESTLVGRTQEQTSIEEAWRASWLVTVTGPAGVGKTTLATAIAGEAAPFVDLSQVPNEASLLRAVCHAMGVHTGPGDDINVVAQGLDAGAHPLIVFDNAETVVRPLGELLRALVPTLSTRRVLVTSRVVLGLPFERVVDVGPLPLHDARVLLERLLPAAATEPLEPLLEALDCLPLAIELCAPRLRLLPPRKLAQRLQQRFEVLATQPAGPRHRSLRAALDDSWALLDDSEQGALARLTAWSAPLPVELAEAWLGPGGLDLLQVLRDHSWLTVDSEGRLELLPTLRDYVAQEASDHDLHIGFRDHAAYVADCVTSVMDGGPLLAHGHPDLARLVAMPFDVVNAATRTAELGMEVLVGPTAVAALHVLVRTGPIPLLRERLEAAREVALPRDRPLLGRLLADTLVWFEELDEAVAVQRVALDEARRLGDPARIRYHQAGLAAQLFRAGHRDEGVQMAATVVDDPDLVPASEASLWAREVLVWDANARADTTAALGVLSEMFRIVDTAGMTRYRTRTLRSMGYAYVTAGRVRTALGCYEEVLRTVTEQGRLQATVEATLNVGLARAMCGDVARAESDLGSALELAEMRGPRKLLAAVLQSRGWLEIERGRPSDAVAWLRRSQKVLQDLPQADYAVRARALLGVTYAELGDAGAAIAEMALAEPLLSDVGSETESEWWVWLACVQWHAGRYDDVLDSTLRPAARSVRTDILCWCLRAASLEALGESSQAREARARAVARFEESEFPPEGFVGKWLDRAASASGAGP